MRLRHLYLLGAFLLLPLQYAAADDYQHISVNGTELTKHVDKITFSQDDIIAILSYNDQTTDSVLTAGLKIALSYSDPSGIDNVSIYGGVSINGNTLSIKGLKASAPVYIYDVGGKLQIRTKAGDTETTVDITSLRPGTYILRCGNKVIKFERR